jgi:formate dehydrogenase subunit gamma
MNGCLITLVLAAALAWALPGASRAQAASPAATPAPVAEQAGAKPKAAPPAGFVAPAEPKPDESNAERSKSQPGNNAPMWRAVRDSGPQPGITSLPGPELGVLVQPFVQYPGSRLTSAGEAWRQVRNSWIVPYGGALLLIALGAVGIFYWRKGTMGGHLQDTGRKVERFTPFERSAHWVNAVAFMLLAVSGIVLAFGKFFLLPVLGATLFGWLSFALKNVHNFVGPLFAVSLVVVIFTFVRDNLPAKGDGTWLLKGGGLMGDHEVPSHRFNAGEKVLFWAGVFALGLIVVGSGLVLNMLVPGWGETRGQMQIAHMLHAAAAVLMMALFVGHIYMGTIGMSGAFQAMRTGMVDEAWAKEHHEFWYDDIKAGKIPAVRSSTSAPAVGSEPRRA